MSRIDRWMERILPEVVRRAGNGGVPQPRWLPRRLLTVVSADIDPDTDTGAIWFVWRPRSSTAQTCTALIERYDGEWRYTGAGSAPDGRLPADAGRPAAGRPGQVGMIELLGGAGGLSHADCLRLRDPALFVNASWVGANQLQVAAEVEHVLVGGRRVGVPRNGNLVVVWRAPSGGRMGTRPPIVAVGRDGSELSRLAPHGSLDSYTWSRLSDQEEQER
jgi:hypothetical protein